jgi:hypothetical protein
MNSGVLPRRPAQLFAAALQAALRRLIRSDHKPWPPPARGQLAPGVTAGGAVLSSEVGVRTDQRR